MLKLFLFVCGLAGLMLVIVAEAAGASNSMVRFRISSGTTRVGDIDVELFDHDKPITVSNFLQYVQAGAYDRSILHRCVPGFIVQGGLYTVENPYSPALFSAMTRIQEGQRITNEFNVGPRIPNGFGTLAMALYATDSGTNSSLDPNSAAASWLFNTADNSDALDPDYTVFGRVKTGAKFLKSFNALDEDEGIINMFGLSYQSSPCDYLTISGQSAQVALRALPVSYRVFDCPTYDSIFNVQVIMLSGRDVAPPRITLTSPAANESVTDDITMVMATVTDNAGVKSVRAYLDDRAPVAATFDTTSSTWSVTLTNASVGTNLLFVEATDTSDNRSTISREFIRSVLMPIGLHMAGSSCVEVERVTNMLPVLVTSCGGTIQGPTNGQFLEVGRSYTVIAKPAPGNLFDGWRMGGALISPYPAFSFIMESNLNLTAVFNTNLFPFVKGTYTGLFCDTNQVEEWNSGFFTLTLGNLGSYSAKVWIEGKPYTFSGSLDSGTGYGVNFLFPNPLTSSNDLFIRLNLDLIGGSDRLSGSFSNYYRYLTFSTNSLNPGIIAVTNRWVAELRADRPVFTPANPAPLAGKYTLILPADTNSTTGPAGDGYGTATINTRGSLTFSGSLADGTKVTQKVLSSKYGDWPLYLNLYKGMGMLVSRLVFDTNAATTDLSGLANWFKRTQTAGYYSGGFTNEAMIVGSRFTPPTGTNRLLELTTGVAGFTNGNLVIDFANDVTLDASGKLTNLDANKLNLRISRSSGLMSGSVTPPFGKAVSFKGVVLQKWTNGFGFFLGTSASGRVSLGQK